MDEIGVLVKLAAGATNRAAAACREWEDGGDPVPVSDTASVADEAISVVVEAVADIYPTFSVQHYPETRLGRLVVAARLLVLAGIDEHGRSEDLEMATRVLELAKYA